MMVIIISLIIILLLSYVISILKHKKIDSGIRRSAGASSFIDLTHGFAEYELAGPEDGSTVILVSGFSVPFFCWDHVFGVLAGKGYRVLRYNHYGRGLSDHAGVRYDADLFENQLDEITLKLGIRIPFTLVGLSMGGAVSVYYANRHPEKVKRIALISPAGFPTNVRPAIKLLKTPLIGSYITNVLGDVFLKSRSVANLFSLKKHPEYQEKFAAYLKYRGRISALLSTSRNMLIKNMEEEYENLPSDIPVLLMWGREDAVIPYSNNEFVRRAIKQTEFYAIENAGHNSQYEAPDQVLGHLLKFLAE